MTSVLIVIVTFALVYWALERNHVRQAHLHGRLYGHLWGSSEVEDRDLARLHEDLRAAADHQQWQRTLFH